MRRVFFTGLLLLLGIAGYAQDRPQTAGFDLQELARSVTGDNGDAFERTRRLVKWMNTSFQWTYTDYQKRTVEEIVQRRAGNCAELANVLYALLQSVRIRARWIAEINIQPASPGRQANAAALMKRIGNKGSVFGLMHNDHRWLEVFDETTQTWFAADPAVGVVGLKEWTLARLGFGTRPTSPVPEIAKTVQDMIVPFVVLALESKTGNPQENRSAYYLIEGFDRVYGDKLRSLPSWQAWTEQVNRLGPIAASAFRGETNLHESEPLIASLARTYRSLSLEATTRHLTPSSAER